jgi:glucose-6-phosphate isomerase
MLPNQNPTRLEAWKNLSEHFDKIKNQHLKDYFDEDPQRMDRCTAEGAGILLDYSKNHLNAETLDLLMALGRECQIPHSLECMRKGSHINQKEDRAVMHIALRSDQEHIDVDGTNVMPLVRDELKKMRSISEGVHSGQWKGYTGKRIRYVVNIGIGGSDLGPQMVCQALRPYWTMVTPFFLSNIDAAHWEEIKSQIQAEETLFIVASKTFTTDETMTNARTVRTWLLEQMGGDEKALEKHFMAVSTNLEEVKKFGIPENNIVGFWNWVGGRFSLWSSIGLSIACTVGFDHFEDLLRGACKMDHHFFNAELENNLPVIMALITVWQVNFFGFSSHAILPYDHRLKDFPRFLQQLIMESNGKQVGRDQHRVNYSTCPIYFGEPGTNGQHAFYQLLHQGADIIPSDFLVIRNAHHDHDEHHHKLVANCLAQSEALMDGLAHEDPFRNFEGNRPSNTLVLDSLTPENLGALIALYEHQVFVQGIIWNIYSFDQWGVELGKALAKKIVKGDEESSNPSTRYLIHQLKN